MKNPIFPKLFFGIFVFCLIYSAIGNAQTVIELDMMSQDDKPLVSARINGQTAYFLVDTGSDISLLFAEFKDAFGFQTNSLSPGGLKSLTAVQGNSMSLQRTYNARVQAEGCFFPMRFPALQGGRYLEVVEQNTALKIVGIIGVDMMKQLKVQIDYSRNKVAMTFPDRVCEDKDETVGRDR